MKRQRGNRPTKVTKKKLAVKAEEAAEEKVEERRDTKDSVATVEETAECASIWSGVDEEMSWATSWCPFWELEAMGDAVLFGDVLWDYDIWDLKTSLNAPIP
ncbi:hypothetical protein BUALT_Bualt05G0127700 [Buddleja alternifolia]|uniref:Uncharacterized protein n=1 Tax=Buddleja alternifolia TaxID=168488 RepID=A0AAV6XK87_9LAMI|nr:hypothetical protein BUALT_Bualt05G0127700 [Buddleja alternifolia]